MFEDQGGEAAGSPPGGLAGVASAERAAVPDAVPDWVPGWTEADLHGVAPGPDLAFVLEFGDERGALDADLVEAVAAWQRMVAWATAGAARAAAALAERASMNPTWPGRSGAVAEPCVAGEEIAMRLACSRRAGRELVRHGRAFSRALAPTGDALAAGTIDPAKARVLVEALDRPEVPGMLAWEVQERVLPAAPGRTPAQLARDVAAALVTCDPGGAVVRRQGARRGRRVDRPRVLPDGMAGVWAVLDVADAVRLDSTIDDLARAARAHGDPRTLDQLRADVLVELTVGSAAEDGPVVAGGAADREGEGVATVATVRCRCGGRRTPRTQVHVTVPLTTLAGLDDGPGEVAGYGPVDAGTARLLAAGGIWLRLVTDPLSGEVLDVGRTRYRPPAHLAEHVRARDRACARPGCAAQAQACDLDHTREWARDGTTSADNLGPLCPRDHTLKTGGGFRLTQVRPGRFRWTTPTGHIYEVTPGTAAPRTHRPPGGDRRGAGGVGAPGTPGDDDVGPAPPS